MLLGRTGRGCLQRRRAGKRRNGPSEGGYRTQPRVLHTPFVEEWNQRQDEVEREAQRLSNDLITAIHQGRAHELVPFSGQTAGMIHEIMPAGEIVRRMVAEAEETLQGATELLS
jgi:enoyl-[acyl-carrier protein] reductase II